MSGEVELSKLLASMAPVLDDSEYIFVHKTAENSALEHCSPRMVFCEQEGETWIITSEQANQWGLKGQYPCKMITLNIHSALNAIGFLAHVTDKLAKQKISVNAVSAYYHDHLFVSIDQADQAMEVLLSITDSPQS